MNRTLLVLGVAVGFLSRIQAASTSAEKQQRQHKPVRALGKPLAIGTQAPPFVASDARGNRWALARLHGKKVVLNFLCGCTPCRELAKAEGGRLTKWKNTRVLVISYMDARDIPEFVKQTGLEVPYLMDPFGDIGSKYESLDCPVVWLVNERGVIRFRSSMRAKDTRNVLEQLNKLL